MIFLQKNPNLNFGGGEGRGELVNFFTTIPNLKKNVAAVWRVGG